MIAEPADFSLDALRILSEVAQVECRALSQADVCEALASFDGLWIRLGLNIRASDIPSRPRCQMLVTATTGVDHVDAAALEKAGIALVSLRGRTDFLRTVSATAEHTVALLLALTRRVPWAFEAARAGRWDREAFRGHELQGKTAGIVGYGRLGRLVARLLTAFGMRVVAFDTRDGAATDGVTRAPDLDSLLRESDIVSVHVDLNPTSERLFDRRRFAVMKFGTYFINTSRGAIVDEEALIAALNSGRLAGAAIDVLSGEPAIDDRHPLVRYAAQHANLLITPHIGGATFESMAKCEVYLAEVVRQELQARTITTRG